MGTDRIAAKESSTRPAASREAASAAPVSLMQRLGNENLQRLLSARALQAKLSVSSPDDPYEQEADRVADQVMRMPASAPQVATHAAPAVQRVCSKCEEELQRSEDSAAVPTVDAATETSITSLSGRGDPLPQSVRSFMEPRFNADFNAVRVHNDAHAHTLARSVSAQAFTVGHNVVFGAGHYSPDSDHGKHLLAHELTHVIQQRGTVARRPAAEPLFVVRTLSREEARAVLIASLESGGRSEDSVAMEIIESTLRQPFTLQNSAARVRQLTAAFSLLGNEDAARVLAALTAPAGDKQKALHERFGNLDRGFRNPLLEILRMRAGEKPASEATAKSDAKWIEVHEGVFAYVPNTSTTLAHVATYLSGNPEVPAALAELNGLDPDTPVPAARPIVVPIEYIDRTDAIRDMPAKVRQNIGSRRQAAADNAALRRFIKVRSALDPYEQKFADFKAACRMSVPYIPTSITRHAGEVAQGLLTGLLEFAWDAVKILAISTAVGAIIGAIVSGGPGFAPGAAVGFEVGLLILNVYGLYSLVESVLSMAGAIVGELSQFFHLFWTAGGRKSQLDLSGRALAEGIGLLVGAVLMGIVAYLLKKGGEAFSKTRFAKTVGEKPFAEWLKARSQLRTTRAVLAARTESVLLRGQSHEVRFDTVEGRLRACLCTHCTPIIERTDALLERTPESHEAHGELMEIRKKALEADTWVGEALEGELGESEEKAAKRVLDGLRQSLNKIERKYPDLFDPEAGTRAPGTGASAQREGGVRGTRMREDAPLNEVLDRELSIKEQQALARRRGVGDHTIQGTDKTEQNTSIRLRIRSAADLAETPAPAAAAPRTPAPPTTTAAPSVSGPHATTAAPTTTAVTAPAPPKVVVPVDPQATAPVTERTPGATRPMGSRSAGVAPPAQKLEFADPVFTKANELGRGYYKQVYRADGVVVAVPIDPANWAEIDMQIRLLKQLRTRDGGAFAKYTAEALGPFEIQGRRAMVMPEYGEGSRSIVRPDADGRWAVVAESQYLNEVSIQDIEKIAELQRKYGVDIQDKQYLIATDGHVYLSDPMEVKTGKPTTYKTQDELLIRVARENIAKRKKRP